MNKVNKVNNFWIIGFSWWEYMWKIKMGRQGVSSQKNKVNNRQSEGEEWTSVGKHPVGCIISTTCNFVWPTQSRWKKLSLRLLMTFPRWVLCQHMPFLADRLANRDSRATPRIDARQVSFLLWKPKDGWLPTKDEHFFCFSCPDFEHSNDQLHMFEPSPMVVTKPIGNHNDWQYPPEFPATFIIQPGGLGNYHRTTEPCR